MNTKTESHAMKIVEYDAVDPMGVFNLTLLALDFPLTPEHAEHLRRKADGDGAHQHRPLGARACQRNDHRTNQQERRRSPRQLRCLLHVERVCHHAPQPQHRVNDERETEECFRHDSHW